MTTKCRYCDNPATRIVTWRVGFKRHLQKHYLCDGTTGKACDFKAGHLTETRIKV
ncbi:hypothetical protein LCGC14_0845850 [marine sediment metagenome]|uniref:Uncharacterized protein n=1 Tax=marine sediment metagenome TaxID=412755 RepID=A0A0F9PGM9_9ZZZZ